MKKSTSQVYSKPQNTRLEEKTETPEVIEKESKVTERIVDRLDLQLLVAVIVFFVSAWVFLNGRICNFTESESANTQMSYIFVHYILTLVLLLCVYITAIKGNYVLKKGGEDISGAPYYCVRLFIECWFPALLVCLGVLLTSPFLPWYVWLAVGSILLFLQFKRMSFKIPLCLSLVLGFVILLPIFVSTMTIIVKDIEIQHDKEYYSLSDDVIISVKTRGYACNHMLTCLGEKQLYRGTKYILEKNNIVVPASCIKNNTITVGTISPASGWFNFWVYPYEKMTGKEVPAKEHFERASSVTPYYTSKSIIIK